MSDKKKKVILAVGAHPDDIDFGGSGTIAKLVSEGWDAYYIVCTDGSRGSADPKMTHEQLATIRKKEQRAAAEILGVKDVYFFDHTDTELQCNFEVKEQIVRVIRTVKPEVVMTIDPTFYFSVEPFPGTDYHFVNHTDHRAVGLATMDAVFPLSRDRLTYPMHEKEGLQPHRTDELWLLNWGRTERDFLVDITGTLDKKLEAIKAHDSQFDNFAETAEKTKRRAAFYAENEEYSYAESFIRLKMP